MASVDLYPDSTVSNTNWTPASSTVDAMLKSTGEGNPAGNGIHCDADGAVCVVTLDDLDFSGLNIDTITSVQVQCQFYMENKGNTNSFTVVRLLNVFVALS